MQKHIPWVEKYRPNDFNDIVLDKFNRKILKNVIKTGNFPNIILYGPPGTGKTTTIINLIKSYQDKHNQKNKNLISGIHLVSRCGENCFLIWELSSTNLLII